MVHKVRDTFICVPHLPATGERCVRTNHTDGRKNKKTKFISSIITRLVISFLVNILYQINLNISLHLSSRIFPLRSSCVMVDKVNPSICFHSFLYEDKMFSLELQVPSCMQLKQKIKLTPASWEGSQGI